jgi:transcriptional regulator with XRE-family HTH domain
VNNLFNDPWNELGYADIVDASIVDDELRVEFDNGDRVAISVGRLGLREPSGVDVDRESGLGLRVHTVDGPVDVSWTQIRAAADPAFAQEMRKHDSEEARRIGLRLKALREDKGISQKHLAEHVAMSPAQLAKIESGTFDLRLSTISALLRGMGASLVDIAGRDVPEVSTREVGRLARTAGVPREVVDQILATVRRSAVTNAMALAFGWDPSALLAGSPASPRLAAAVQFKSADPDAATGAPLLTMAYRASEWITHAANLTGEASVPIDVRELRSAALDASGHLTLASLLGWTWEAGIPVVPILGRGAFAAASWSLARRPVIVLKDSRAFAAFWLFDLAHELGHIALGHVHEGGIVDIDSPTPLGLCD